MSDERMIRVALVDDEPLARAAIRAALASHDDMRVVLEAADGPEALARMRDVAVDAVFLDIRLPGLDGFGVVDQLPSDERPAIVFVTAFDDRAVDAFGVHAVDYLVKPFDDTRFKDTIAHLRRHLARQRDLGRGAHARPREPHTRIQVRDGPHIRFVDVADLRYVETDGNHLVLHLTAGETARIRHTLKDLMGVLDRRRFVRIHRSTAVNLDHVREVQPWFSGDYICLMRSGEELRVSRHYREGLLRTTF